MATKEDILGQFQLFNINPSDEVLSKCLEMCLKYNVDGEDLVDQWFAYTSSVLRGAAPSVEYLERMERKEFMKNKDQEVKRPVYFEDQDDVIQSPGNRTTAPAADVALSTPKGNHAAVSKLQTPTQGRKLLQDSLDVASPSVSSGTYSKRTDAQLVRCSYGYNKAKFERTSNIQLVIKPLYEDGLKPNQKVMCEVLRKRGRCIDAMTEELFKAISKQHNLNLNDDNVNMVGDNELLYGRIVSDTDWKINNESVQLEQTQKFKGNIIKIILSKLPKYSIFSGQVVAVKGTPFKTKNTEIKMIVEEIYTDTDFNLLEEPPLVNDTLQLVVACGPFTTQDTLSFEPLNDLLQYAQGHHPHVLILTGPFYDKNHQGIQNGELRQSYDSFFFDLIDNVMRGVPDSTQVIIVASQKDPHHLPVYPTPPYEVRLGYPNLTFMPDPCMVSINGLVVGVTTADILFDIGGFEISVHDANSGQPDRMSRLASHLLKQQSFYPLDPPSRGRCIDFSLMERNGVMGVKPHLLILPSNFRHFVKEVDNCVVINPERLTKGNGGGTFARVEISPGNNPTVCGRTACEILKI